MLKVVYRGLSVSLLVVLPISIIAVPTLAFNARARDTVTD